MNGLPSSSRFRFLPAIAAGILLATAFPKPGLAGAAWIAPGLLLFAALNQNGGAAFRLGYVAGLAFYLSSLYWLLLIPYRWHGIPIGPAAGWLALSAYCALYPAVWVWLCLHVSSSQFQVPGSEHADSSVRPLADSVVHSLVPSSTPLAGTWPRRILWPLACAGIWVALEMIRGRLLTGFPWNFLGASQYRLLPLIQIASVTGVYGVSFLVVWFSVALMCTALTMVRWPTSRSLWLAEILGPFVGIAIVAAFGLMHLAENPIPLAVSLSRGGAEGKGERRTSVPSMPQTLKVALVQPSIPQALIWDPNETTNRFQRLIELSRTALAARPDVLIWPEAALPSFDEANYRAITNLVRTHGVWMIFGADDAEPRTDKEYDFFNAAFLISPEAKLMATYRKRRLVIFGEFVPLVHWLPFMKWLTPFGGGFTPGDRPVPFDLNPVAAPSERRSDSPSDPPQSSRHGGTAAVSAKTSVLICFEDTFPHLARENVADDTDFLLNLTNDGWFGESAAQWQQTASAVFRAVENGVPLLRCANNGLTCSVDGNGRLREIFGNSGNDVYRAGFLTTEVPLLAGKPRPPTFYHRHGDWVGWGCVVLTVGLLGLQVIDRKK